MINDLRDNLHLFALLEIWWVLPLLEECAAKGEWMEFESLLGVVYDAADILRIYLGPERNQGPDGQPFFAERS